MPLYQLQCPNGHQGEPMLYQVIRKFLFCLLLVGGMAQAGNAAMPNLPSTATVLLDCPFNSVGNPMCGGLVVNSYNAGSIASDSTAPESPNNVYAYFRSGGATTGGTQLDFFYSQSAEIYVEKEKKRLIEETGVDSEELRLYCRTLATRLNIHAERHLENYRKSRPKDHTSV